MEQRESMPDYDLREVFDIKEIWELWGATVHVAAAKAQTQGHTIAFNGHWFDSEINSAVETDVLLVFAVAVGHPEAHALPHVRKRLDQMLEVF